MRRPYPTDHSEVDEPVRLAGAGPRHRCPPRSFHPLEGGSDPPCWRPPFTSRPHAHRCRSLLVSPGSPKQVVVPYSLDGRPYAPQGIFMRPQDMSWATHSHVPV